MAAAGDNRFADFLKAFDKATLFALVPILAVPFV